MPWSTPLALRAQVRLMRVTPESLGLWQCQLCSCSLDSMNGNGSPCGYVCSFLNPSPFLREMTTGDCWIHTAKDKPTMGDSKRILFAGVKEELTAATLKLLPR